MKHTRERTAAVLSVVASIVVTIATSTEGSSVPIDDEVSWTGIAYDRITLAEVGPIEAASIRASGGSLQVEFDLLGNHYSIAGNATSLVETQRGSGAYEASPRNGARGFNLVYARDDYVTGSAFVQDKAPQHFSFDDRLAFTLKAVPHSDSSKKSSEAADASLMDDISAAITMFREGMVEDPSPIVGGQHAVAPMAWGSAHVLVDNQGIPFLVSGGFSEGWVDITPSGPTTHIISNLRYSISAGWASDSVSLWYNGQTNSLAYRSPAWPSGGLHYASGSWAVNTNYAQLLAENTYTVLVRFIPIMYTRYDSADV